ncbi:MAG: 1-deoxy-D-xylulose-5-phosphate reductoisomerase [Candidatus Melainabacteria bacterium RIFOXYA12_FULL_32_12]|nr:MAG: 1-deoxy-D-xylulose-5-phosphate reductoisomerase [Candidatus Melainabacteria bacterium RIFOXYA2_FULL_32_9]OGI30744.1 MAG: 1-deoxy-D-xylulose-5-phosphate reductoisomerase [Candidatus Melainabacteria bacterium RIFOXYA12_FULL_32_12]
MKRKISILGSTGSIGKQALEVVDSLPEQFEIYGLAAGANIEILKEQINKYKPEAVSVKNEELADQLANQYKDIKILWGDEGLIEIAQNAENNTVLVAVAGLAGLYPTLAAINNNVDVALANKETLVAAGSIVMERAKKNNVKILPVDSEHSAIHQCIDGRISPEIRKLIVTGSGGPFRGKSFEEMDKATVEETLSHPRWSMGDKITVDSATLMNKGLEVIEAHWLFDIDYNNIDVVIHPQSIVHSAVEFLDGSVIAQLGIPSMHIPIQYALTYPERYKGLETGSLNLIEAAKLEFEAPDLTKFPCLKLAYEAGIKGGTYPAVLNAANEEAVYAFLNKKIKLTDIVKIVEKTLEAHINIENPDLKDIINSDTWAREFVKETF